MLKALAGVRVAVAVLCSARRVTQTHCGVGATVVAAVDAPDADAIIAQGCTCACVVRCCQRLSGVVVCVSEARFPIAAGVCCLPSLSNALHVSAP